MLIKCLFIDWSWLWMGDTTLGWVFRATGQNDHYSNNWSSDKPTIYYHLAWLWCQMNNEQWKRKSSVSFRLKPRWIFWQCSWDVTYRLLQEFSQRLMESLRWRWFHWLGWYKGMTVTEYSFLWSQLRSRWDWNKHCAKSYYPPGNHHASLFEKLSYLQVITTC